MQLNLPAVPVRYLTINEPGISGLIKKNFTDFKVEEIPLYLPSGIGEHLFITIEKQGLPTLQVIRELARLFHIPVRNIGYAGLKDKNAVTTQQISILSKDDSPLNKINIPGLRILSVSRHCNKIRMGHLKGNKFTIKIRNSKPDQLPQIRKTMEILCQLGLPNFIDEQRFGNNMNNHEIGHSYLLQDWDRACRLLLGDAELQSKINYQARLAFDHNDYQKAYDAWPYTAHAERTALLQLIRGKNSKQAIMAIDHNARQFYVSAFQSAIFNNLLADRIDNGYFSKLIPGDLAWKHNPPGAGAVFEIHEPEQEAPEINDRMAKLDISPSGPIWGFSMKQAGGIVGNTERDSLLNTGLDIDQFNTPPHNYKGTRRPYRTPVTDMSCSEAADNYGTYYEIQFTLSKGSYATILIKEITKNIECLDYQTVI